VPPDVLQRLTREVGEIMRQPEVKDKCAQLSLEAVAVGSDALRALMKTDIARFQALGQRLKLTLD
jgi:tripartite-type tricarboxylate transporter receptor subunit TctC